MNNKIYKDIVRMPRYINVIEQYNNFRQLNAEEDISFLKEKVKSLFEIKDTIELIKEFTWCSKMINMYYNEIDLDFKTQILKEERKKEEELENFDTINKS